MEEKLAITTIKNKNNLLYKKNEIMAKCRHINKPTCLYFFTFSFFVFSVFVSSKEYSCDKFCWLLFVDIRVTIFLGVFFQIAIRYVCLCLRCDCILCFISLFCFYERIFEGVCLYVWAMHVYIHTDMYALASVYLCANRCVCIYVYGCVCRPPT